jgi:tRNA1(Val) A37 N6-methylase TrmN6
VTAPTTEDALLGGRVVIAQPARGYRAAIDPVLLAAAVPARPGERVLELGCGTGAAALCLLARVPGVHVTGVEIEPEIAALARRNALANGEAERFSIVEGDAESARLLAGALFDHAMLNPPFHDSAAARPAADPLKARANAALPGALAAWIALALRRLKGAGTVTLIHKPERLGAILAALDGGAGGILVKPLQPRAEAPATRIVVQAAKGSRAPLALLPPLVLHAGDGRPSAALEPILRDAVALPLLT